MLLFIMWVCSAFSSRHTAAAAAASTPAFSIQLPFDAMCKDRPRTICKCDVAVGASITGSQSIDQGHVRGEADRVLPRGTMSRSGGPDVLYSS